MRLIRTCLLVVGLVAVTATAHAFSCQSVCWNDWMVEFYGSCNGNHTCELTAEDMYDICLQGCEP
jgi:hypothetical protein